jgi:hypothetical protein
MAYCSLKFHISAGAEPTSENREYHERIVEISKRARCGFDSMAQCHATSAGLGGDCFRDPALGDSRSAFAYQPKSLRSRHGLPAAGTAADTGQ